MLSYPSIPRWKETKIGRPCIAFYKYDGSNLRWEWTPKRGWYKYGTRTQLFDHTAIPFNQAIPLFEQIGNDVVEIVNKANKRKVERIVAFTEFFGQSSFAGSHDVEEPKQLVLFDVSVYKRGFIPATDFVDLFGHLPYAAKVVYEGNMNMPFIDDVRNGRYPVHEGVICKGKDWNAKIKTNAFLQRLKDSFGDRWQQFE